MMNVKASSQSGAVELVKMDKFTICFEDRPNLMIDEVVVGYEKKIG